MAEINNTVPSIVRGSSLYEAMCKVAEIANNAIGDADTANKGVTEAKAAAAAAQQTANQAHEEAINAANSAEQAGEKAQEAQLAASSAVNEASKAKDAADKAQTTADGAAAENTQQNTRIDNLETGETVIPTYFKTTAQGNAIPGMNGNGTAAVYYWAAGSVDGDIPLRRHGQSDVSKGGILVPQTPKSPTEAASKHYVDEAVATAAGGITTSLVGQFVPADENGTAISTISVQRIGASGFFGTVKNISFLDIDGEIATKYDENPSKKLSFDITGVLGDGGNPGVMGKIPINVFSGTNTHFALAEFNANTGKLVIDCSQFDPSGGNVWKVFSQHAYYKY